MPHNQVGGPADAVDDIEAVELPVFHGTRKSAALAIYANGFNPVPVNDQVAAVAARYAMPVDTLNSHLDENFRFTHVDARLGTVSLTADPEKAGSWADRAPEATWEALWSVYRLRHRELGHEWNQSDEGHFWVLAQRWDDPPVVVEAMAPISALNRVAGQGTAADLLRALRDTNSADHFPSMYTSMPEWRADPSNLRIIGLREVPFRLDGSLARFISGEDPADFAEQVENGVWGQPAGNEPLVGDWFSFREIWRRITPSRRAELEAIAGMSFTAQIRLVDHSAGGNLMARRATAPQ